MPSIHTGLKSLEQIEQDATAKGWKFEKEPAGLMGWVRVHVNLKYRPNLDWVYFSPSTGYFFGDGFTSETHMTGADTAWFEELLHFFYSREFTKADALEIYHHGKAKLDVALKQSEENLKKIEEMLNPPARTTFALDVDWIRNAIQQFRIQAGYESCNWVVCRVLFGTGRTKAVEICTAISIDPDGDHTDPDWDVTESDGVPA